MNLIKFNHRYDFGHDLYVQVLNIKNWSLLQVSVSWNEYVSGPYIQIRMGSGSLFSLLFWIHKFGFDVDIASRTWNFDYLKDIDD